MKCIVILQFNVWSTKTNLIYSYVIQLFPNITEMMHTLDWARRVGRIYVYQMFRVLQPTDKTEMLLRG